MLWPFSFLALDAIPVTPAAAWWLNTTSATGCRTAAGFAVSWATQAAAVGGPAGAGDPRPHPRQGGPLQPSTGRGRTPVTPPAPSRTGRQPRPRSHSADVWLPFFPNTDAKAHVTPSKNENRKCRS